MHTVRGLGAYFTHKGGGKTGIFNENQNLQRARQGLPAVPADALPTARQCATLDPFAKFHARQIFQDFHHDPTQH